jgi:hypothetical protein
LVDKKNKKIKGNILSKEKRKEKKMITRKQTAVFLLRNFPWMLVSILYSTKQ